MVSIAEWRIPRRIGVGGMVASSYGNDSDRTNRNIVRAVIAFFVVVVVAIGVLIVRQFSSDESVNNSSSIPATDAENQTESEDAKAIREFTESYVNAMGTAASLGVLHCGADGEQANKDDGFTYSLAEISNIRVDGKYAYARVAIRADDGRSELVTYNLWRYATQDNLWRRCNSGGSAQALEIMAKQSDISDDDRDAIESAFVRYLETFTADNPRDPSVVCDEDLEYAYAARNPPTRTAVISDVRITGLDVEGENAVLYANWSEKDSIGTIREHEDELGMMRKSPEGAWQECGRIEFLNGSRGKR